jgi:hypothetical protein
MPMNHVQFQPGLSMADFMRRFGTQAQCEAALTAARPISGAHQQGKSAGPTRHGPGRRPAPGAQTRLQREQSPVAHKSPAALSVQTNLTPLYSKVPS